jgi:site-specific recombinase XerD
VSQVKGSVHWNSLQTTGHLYRLRKTCASSRGASGFPVRAIQHMLGHKSLETTQKYLGITKLDSLTDKIDAAAKVVAKETT